MFQTHHFTSTYVYAEAVSARFPREVDHAPRERRASRLCASVSCVFLQQLLEKKTVLELRTYRCTKICAWCLHGIRQRGVTITNARRAHRNGCIVLLLFRRNLPGDGGTRRSLRLRSAHARSKPGRSVWRLFGGACDFRTHLQVRQGKEACG